MKKKFTSALIAAVMVTLTVLSSLTGIISASVIDKSGYPFANNKTVLVYDYSSSGNDNNTLNGLLSEYVSFADGEMHVSQELVGGKTVKYKFYQQTQAPSENNGMYITVKNNNNTDIHIAFLPYLGKSSLPKGVEGSKYYLISNGKYEEFDYEEDNNNTIVKIPANYNGVLSVKFDSFLNGKNAFEATDVEGFWIVLYDVPEDSKQYLAFDDFGFIGGEKEAGELEESEYPYTASNRWDEFTFEELPGCVAEGTFGEISVAEGKLYASLKGTVKGNGIKFPISCQYTGNYNAAYFKVKTNENALLVPRWTVGGKTCTIAEGGEYFIRTSAGSLYKKAVGADKAIAVEAYEEVIITVPYESIVISGSTTVIPEKPVITAFELVFENNGPMGDSAYMTLDDIGFVKKSDNTFIIPPRMNGNIVTEEELNFSFTTDAKLVLNGTKKISKLYGCETLAGVAIDQRNIVVDEKKGQGLPISGNPMFELSFSLTKEYQGLTFYLDTTEVGKDLNVQLQFTQGGTYCFVGKGESYYLINDYDGMIYRYIQTEKGAEDNTIFVPMNFKGKVLVAFKSLKSLNADMPFNPDENMSKVAISFVDLNGVNTSDADLKQLWINDVYQIRDLDSVGDKSYKIDIKIMNFDVSGRGLMNSDVSPASGMDPTYWLYSHAEDFVNCFTTDGAYEGTGERLTAVRAIGNRNCWGVGYGGSWTCVGKNAIIYYIDATGAPNLSYKPLLFPQTMKSYDVTDENGNKVYKRDGETKKARYGMGRWTLTSESKIFFVNERTGKAKLANISGNNLVLDGFKGFVVIPFLEMKYDDVTDAVKEGLVGLKDISLVTGVSMQFMMGGMVEGEYVTFDYSGLAYVECPQYIETWNPSGITVVDEGGSGTGTGTGTGGEITPSAPTGVDPTSAVATAAILGAGAFGFGGYNMVSKKRRMSRAEKRGER